MSCFFGGPPFLLPLEIGMIQARKRRLGNNKDEEEDRSTGRDVEIGNRMMGNPQVSQNP